MGVFALKHCKEDFADGHEEGSDPNSKRFHLSLVSHYNWSVIATADLRFELDDEVYGSSCRSLAYFMGEDKIVVCNLVNREWIVFSLPDNLTASYKAENVELEACGLGYDHKSGDYKLFRNYIEHVSEKEFVRKELVRDRYIRSKNHTELYSFKSASWKMIMKPEVAIMYPCAVYVGGSCYWTTVGLEEDDPGRHHILAFDIATERFNHLSFPQSSIDDPDNAKDALFKVVEYKSSLAALIHNDCDYSSPLYLNLFVRREDTWTLLFDLTFENVKRPLSFGESSDGSILFFEGKHTDQSSELMVYTFNSKELKKLGIYNYRSHMTAISFDLKRCRLPSSTPMEPMAFVDITVPTRRTSEDVEEMKTRSIRCRRAFQG